MKHLRPQLRCRRRMFAAGHWPFDAKWISNLHGFEPLGAFRLPATFEICHKYTWLRVETSEFANNKCSGAGLPFQHLGSPKFIGPTLYANCKFSFAIMTLSYVVVSGLYHYRNCKPILPAEWPNPLFTIFPANQRSEFAYDYVRLADLKALPLRAFVSLHRPLSSFL